MSELINTHDNRATIRWKLLTSASAFALTLSSISAARAEDTSHPLIWIELGGTLENIAGQGEAYAPGFLAANPNSPVLNSVTPVQAQKPPRFNFGEEGAISFQPEDSSWVFSAAIRYGRSGGSRHVQHQTDNTFYTQYKYGQAASGEAIHAAEDFADTHARRSQTHAILDFSAGKDVGLGIFGSSVLSGGVRFAQFSSASSVNMRARPDLGFKYAHFTYYHLTFKRSHFHSYYVTANASRKFRGVGPSLSWTGSAPIAGNRDGGIDVDWGVNAALLFGRQKAHVKHHETGLYQKWAYVHGTGTNPGITPYHPFVTVYQRSGGHTIDRAVTVPNVGGSIGLSYRYADAKISFGYRADFFFGAMDTGIDAAKKSNAGFYGPYASISIGLGD